MINGNDHIRKQGTKEEANQRRQRLKTAKTDAADYRWRCFGDILFHFYTWENA